MENQTVATVNKSRMIYIILAIFLGTLGVHNFYAGYKKKGITELLLTLFGWLIIPAIAVLILVIIDICTVTTDANGNQMI